VRTWPLHIVFAIILVGSLATRERAGDVLSERDLEPAVIRVAHSRGLVFRQYTTIADTDVRALIFRASRCPRPVLVTVVSGTFDQDLGARTAREQGDELRYIYIDRTWGKPDPLAFFIERMKYAVLATFGLTPYLPSRYLLRVESPPQCRIADAIDWRMVWNRNYLGNRTRIGSH
jgi:hypothetical protein